MNGLASTTAAILVELKEPLVLDEIALPATLDAGQVLVEIHYSGICGSQLGEIDGVKGEDRFLPHLLGHEGSGIVLDVGAGVRHVARGDRVVLHWRKGAGIESPVPAYGWQGRKLNAGWVTTFNRHAVISENRLTRIPPESDLAIAALFGCAVTTGFGVVQNNAHVRIGESVVVFGAGGVGLNIVQAAALVSAYPLIAVDLYDNRLALASRMGATHVINAKNEDAFVRIRTLIGTGGVDHFIDNTGQPAIIQAGYELTAPRGRVTLVGVPRKGADIAIHSLPLHFGKALSGSHGGETVPEQDIPRYHQLFMAGRIRLRELVTETRPLEEINTAIERMRDGSVAGRCLIDMQQGA
jgi:S-(hydroxymethyl)glutathione dehydrogenase/alcohol dehydrogenase